VSRILGVWLSALAAAHAWAALDGERSGARALVVAGPPTGALLALVPLIHRDDVVSAAALGPYLALAAALVAVAAPGRLLP